MVDNASTDKTLMVARKCRGNSPAEMGFRVLQCHTPGAAAARNLGASKANGEFIWFIDADDYIDESAITKLLAKRSKADLIMMGAERSSADGSTSYLSAVDPSRPDWKSRFVRYGMGPWQVIIRRSWWQHYGFTFREGIIQEDMELMSALVLYTDRLASVDEPLYHYCHTPESVLHKAKFNPQIFDIFPALEGLYQRFKAAQAVKKYYAELEWFFIWNLLIDSAKDFTAWPEGHPGFAQARQMLKTYFPTWRRNRFLRQKPLKFRVRVWLNYHK